jgi:nicotinamide mononucleotide (NMN) deamidase PncC
MTLTLGLVFLVLAIICFALAALGVAGPKGGWQPVGLIFVCLFLWP